MPSTRALRPEQRIPLTRDLQSENPMKLQITHYLRALLLVGGAFAAGLASAQVRTTGPDGRVTYTDRPPANQPARTVSPSSGPAGPGAGLPFEVQNAMNRFPVTLYTAEKCSPCEDSRAYLRGRGIPYTELTISNEEDFAILKRLSPDNTVPVMTLGNAKQVGFSSTTWGTALDAAGYPQTSRLPATYKNPPPKPAAPRPQTPPTAANNAPGPDAPVNEPPPIQPSNAPPGFRF